MRQKGEEISRAFSEDLEHIAERMKFERGDVGAQESAGRAAAEKEQSLDAIRKSLHEVYLSDPAVAAEMPSAEPTEHDTAGNHLHNVDEEYKDKIADLVEHAITDGILSAVKEAQKEKNPYLMDMFHDSLARLIQQKMSEQGLV